MTFAEAFNEAATELNDVLSRAEIEFRASNPKVEAEIRSEGSLLGYGQVDGVWKLYTLNKEKRIAIENAPVQVRMRMAFNIARLWQDVRERQGLKCERILDAVDQVDAWLDRPEEP